MATEEIGRRAEEWASSRDARVAGRNPFTLLLCTVRSAIHDRVTGLAAEMAFFALLSLVPVVVALGASLGWLEDVLGTETVAQGRRQAIDVLSTVFSPEVTSEVLRPLIDALLDQQRGGIALSSLAAALWLASRVFTSTLRALDLAYNVEQPRSLVTQRLLALVFAVGAIVVVSLTLVLSVLGPLFGTGREVARYFGLGEAFAFAWQVGRWPVIFLIAVGFFAAVYRFGPSCATSWRSSLPGAIVGVVLWLLVSFGFRLYLEAFGGPGARFAVADEAAALLGVVGAIVAAVLWTFLSGVALLIGGEFNSEWARTRGADGQVGRRLPSTGRRRGRHRA